MRKTPAFVSGTLFFWAGFVCSISFMEAWLKFQAPGVTLPVGLSIGKLIFTTLNRMEWAFMVLVVILTFPKFNNLPKTFFYGFAAILLILILQTFILLPELNQRAELIISGTTPGKSNVHLLFGVAEVLKVTFLVYMGFYTEKQRQFSSKKRQL
jgi:hypothetical protein